MKRILFILTMAITAFFGVTVHGQTVPTGAPQRVQHPYYQYDGFIEAKGGILLSRRVANFTPKSPALIYDTVSGRVSFYTGGWKQLQNVAYTADYTDLINRPDLTQYVPTSRSINGYSLTSNVTINKVDVGLGNVQNVDVTNAVNITAGTLPDARLSANVTMQGNNFNGANQLLQLDAGGKVAYANLPAALMIYKGVWDASTNTPTLADGSGVNGWVYRVHPGGTVNFGSGSITFSSGDYVIYNGSVWQQSGGGDAVTSVNGQQGVVVLSTANISEGGTNYYYTNARVQTFGDTRYSLLNHEHVYSDIANLSSYTGFDVRYKSISYVPAWSDITGKPSFATVATSGAYSDLSGTPSLGSLAALSNIGNAYITDVAWSKVTGAPSFLTTETDPTIYAWAKASVKPSYTYAEIGGTVPTWNQNTTGNAATATTAINWGVVPNSLNSPAEASGLSNLIGVHSNTYAYKFTAGAVQSWLGLGSNAYTSTAFLALTGGTLTGVLNGTSAMFTDGSSTTAGVNINAAIYPAIHLNSSDPNSSNRNWRISGVQSAYGLFEITSSTTAGGAPLTPRFAISGINGQVLVNTTTYSGITGSAVVIRSSSFNEGQSAIVIKDYNNIDRWVINGQSGVSTYNYTIYSAPTGTNDYTKVFEITQSGVTTLSSTLYYSGELYNNTNNGYLRGRNSANSAYIAAIGINTTNKVSIDPDGNGVVIGGNTIISGTITASALAKSGGTSSQFLKADGSVDGNTYITSAVTSITGTTNQIAVSASTGAVTVSLTNNVAIPGTITSSASYESSDRRLKKQLTGTRLFGKIESLQARLYEKDGREEYGYYAQDAVAIIPTAVKQRADGYYDLSYTQVFVVKIASLEKRVHDLEQLLQKIYSK